MGVWVLQWCREHRLRQLYFISLTLQKVFCRGNVRHDKTADSISHVEDHLAGRMRLEVQLLATCEVTLQMRCISSCLSMPDVPSEEGCHNVREIKYVFLLCFLHHCTTHSSYSCQLM